MKKWLFILPVLAMLLAACTQQSFMGTQVDPGETTTETRDVNGFNKVLISGTGEATIVQGEEESLTITAGENILPYIRSEVINGQLKLWLDTKQNFPPTAGKILYNISLINVSSLGIEGSGKITSNSLINLDIQHHKLRNLQLMILSNKSERN